MGAVAKQRARDLERRNERCHLDTDRLDIVNVDGSGVEDERIVSDATAVHVEWLGNPDDGLGNHLVVEGGDCFVQRGLGFLHFLVNVREGRKDR